MTDQHVDSGVRPRPMFTGKGDWSRGATLLRWSSRLAVLLGMVLLGIAGCTTAPPPPPPSATLEVGNFWSSQAWNVARYAVSGTPAPTYYCVATTGTAQQALGVLQTADGRTALGVSQGQQGRAPSSGNADSNPPVAFDLVFEPRATLHLDAAPGAPGYLVSVATTDETTRDALPRLLRQSRALTITDRQLGALGRFDLSDSSAALDKLAECARAVPAVSASGPGGSKPPSS